jgi:hypothetical protein
MTELRCRPSAVRVVAQVDLLPASRADRKAGPVVDPVDLPAGLLQADRMDLLRVDLAAPVDLAGLAGLAEAVPRPSR